MKKLFRFRGLFLLFGGLVALFLFTGCMTTTGQYLYDNRVAVYKVVKNGAVTFMTKEQIKSKNLDKLADTIEYAHSINKNTGKIVE